MISTWKYLTVLGLLAMFLLRLTCNVVSAYLQTFHPALVDFKTSWILASLPKNAFQGHNPVVILDEKSILLWTHPPMPLWYLFPGQLAANDGFYLIEDANRGVNPAWSNCCLSEQSTVSKTVLWLSSSLFLEVTELFRVPFGIKELV